MIHISLNDTLFTIRLFYTHDESMGTHNQTGKILQKHEQANTTSRHEGWTDKRTVRHKPLKSRLGTEATTSLPMQNHTHRHGKKG